jgi:hypothetical protein
LSELELLAQEPELLAQALELLARGPEPLAREQEPLVRVLWRLCCLMMSNHLSSEVRLI